MNSTPEEKLSNPEDAMDNRTRPTVIFLVLVIAAGLIWHVARSLVPSDQMLPAVTADPLLAPSAKPWSDIKHIVCGVGDILLVSKGYLCDITLSNGIFERDVVVESASKSEMDIVSRFAVGAIVKDGPNSVLGQVDKTKADPHDVALIITRVSAAAGEQT